MPERNTSKSNPFLRAKPLPKKQVPLTEDIGERLTYPYNLTVLYPRYRWFKEREEAATSDYEKEFYLRNASETWDTMRKEEVIWRRLRRREMFLDDADDPSLDQDLIDDEMSTQSAPPNNDEPYKTEC